jgi:tetratricopeptide (TPR) repeat protein
VAVTPEMLGDAAGFDRAGLRSELVDAGQNADAIADWQFAKTLAGQSNALSAKVFMDRAEREAPELMKQLLTDGPEPAAQPGAEAPGDAVAPGALSPVAILARAPVLRATAGLTLQADVALSVPRVPLPADVTLKRSYGVVVGKGVKRVAWKVGESPDIAKVTDLMYASRVKISEISKLLFEPQVPADLAAGLPHLYFYVIPLALAESYHAFGDYASAESEYLQAASYQYLNTTVEAPYVWGRLATLYRDWGDSLFRQGNAQDALPKYTNVILPDDTEPNSALYTIATLTPGADIARQVLADLPNIATLALDPDILSAIAGIRGQLAKIAGGLDFWGFWTATVPIWSFDYLQGVAINLAQLAVSTWMHRESVC